MIQVLFLGRVDYAEGLRIQAEVEAWRYAHKVGNVLLLLEHPPVLTLGRNANRSNVLAPDALLAARGVTLHQISRGGDVTYHGPGQLVGYPIFDLRSMRTAKGNRMGPVDFVRGMEEALIRVCGSYGIRAGRLPGLTGVWCPGPHPADSSHGPADGSRAARPGPSDSVIDPGTVEEVEISPSSPGSVGKIAAIGIHVSRGITSHGFAFNLTTDLRDFQLINPCGITDKPVTSLEAEFRRRQEADPAAPLEALPSFEAVAHETARQFGMVFQEQMLAMESYASLRAQAEIPAQDAPLAIPEAVRQLAGLPQPEVKC
jgi:lipoyl(octanoyl) transferase